MRLTEAPDDCLTGERDVLEAQRWILGEQSCQGHGELVIVAGRVGGYGNGEHWIGHGPGLHEQGGGWRRPGGSGLGAPELAHRDDAPCDRVVEGLLFGTENRAQQPDSLINVVICMPGTGREMARDVHGIVRPQRP